MNAILAGLQSRGRALITLLILLLIAGGTSYVAAPKEAAPDIDIPIFFVTVVYPGVSVNDSERLLLLPLERELQQLANLDEMVSNAGEGFGIVRLDFLPGSDSDTAMLDVQRAVDVAAPELPERAERPVVNEVNLDLFPILSIALSGPLEERSLLRKARNLRDRLETIDGVLEADIIGEREEMMEILVDPTVLETYRISFQEVADAIDRNNQLVPAGSVHAGAGRIGVVVPGTIESMQDISEIAVRVEEGVVITVGDVAEVRESFMDPLSFARINGDPAFTLDVRPRTGANVLDTVAAVLTELDRARSGWPEALRVTVLQNQAEQIRNLLGDLENTVIIALLLVFLTIIAAMGLRTAILVAVAVPGAFLAGILAISTFGFTLNIVVLFALILVVGMLVDGTIVVVELADRYISEGLHRGEAFLEASQRMAWPIISAVATTMAVFVPMLLWPGMVGEFIVYLPATVIVTLLASLLMALVFIPALGRVFGPVNGAEDESGRRVEGADGVDYSDAGPIVSGYVCLLGRLCRHPALTLAGVIILAAVLYLLYGLLGRGVVFFPEVEPESLQVRVLARGDLSVWEADELERAQRQFELGVGTVLEVNDAKARLAATNANLLQARNRLRLAYETLHRRMNAPVSDVVGLSTAFRAEAPRPDTPESWVEFAELQSLAVRNAELSLDVARAEVDLARSQRYPQIDLVASLQRDYQGENPVAGGIGMETDLAMIGIQLNWPLFAGGAIRSSVRQNIDQKTAAFHQLQDTKRSSALSTESSFIEIESSLEQITALAEALEAVQLSEESTQRAVELGQRTTLDLLNIQRERFQIERNLNAARYQYLLAYLHLHASVGAPIEDAIQSVNAFLENE